MTDTLLSPTFLFRFSVPFRQTDWPDDVGQVELTNRYTLPSFGELEGRPLFADVRGGWHPDGLVFSTTVQGKKQPAWCRHTRLEDSDGLRVWIDTRDAHNIHRANRFCHQFVFLPSGGGRSMIDPVAEWVAINRARENPKTVAKGALQVTANRQHDGYRLRALIHASALTGFDPTDHLRLGFSYAVVDRELGWQTLSVGPEFPIVEDPSLWGTLEMGK